MRELLENLETEMRQKFEVVRSKFEHSGNKGTNTEAILREFLRSYLPRRYGVGHGEIVDSLGGHLPRPTLSLSQMSIRLRSPLMSLVFSLLREFLL